MSIKEKSGRFTIFALSLALGISFIYEKIRLREVELKFTNLVDLSLTVTDQSDKSEIEGDENDAGKHFGKMYNTPIQLTWKNVNISTLKAGNLLCLKPVEKDRTLIGTYEIQLNKPSEIVFGHNRKFWSKYL